MSLPADPDGQQSKDAPKTWLYLPAPDLQIKRSLIRAGIVDPADMELISGKRVSGCRRLCFWIWSQSAWRS